MSSLPMVQGGDKPLTLHSTTATSSGSNNFTCTVVGKVKFLYISTRYGNSYIARVGTDTEYVADTTYYSTMVMFTQNGDQVTITPAASATLTWTIYYWSEE